MEKFLKNLCQWSTRHRLLIANSGGYSCLCGKVWGYPWGCTNDSMEESNGK